MDSPAIKDPIWVDTPARLQSMLEALQACRKVAVDTESNSLHAYKEQVCLIQFSTEDSDYLVDPLALDDLSCLSSLFSFPQIEKIFHAAEYDIICLKRDFGFSFTNIFDTMHAARILGDKEIGLAAVLENEFGLQLDKRFQRANWGNRPLLAEQLDYARLDTHYLIPLQQRLQQRLEEKQLDVLAREDFARLTYSQANNHNEDGMLYFWRLAGKGDLNSQQTAVLYALYQYREHVAERKDRPVFKIFGDSLLLDIAGQMPRTLEALGKIRGMHYRRVKQYGKGFLTAVETGMQKKPPERPVRHFPDGRYLLIVDKLKNWRKETAQRLGVESDIVLPRDVLEEIARQDPDSLSQLERVMADLPWRFQRYGSRILDAIQEPEEE